MLFTGIEFDNLPLGEYIIITLWMGYAEIWSYAWDKSKHTLRKIYKTTRINDIKVVDSCTIKESFPNYNVKAACATQYNKYSELN